MKVAIVPFSAHVNVGAGNYAQTWIDWTDWDKQNGKCSKQNLKTYDDCVGAGRTWTPDNHNTWSGCVADRTKSYDTKSTAPSSTATKFPADQAEYDIPNYGTYSVFAQSMCGR